MNTEPNGPDNQAFVPTDPQLERELRNVLQHAMPPAGFADRVLARAEAASLPETLTSATPERERGRVLRWPSTASWAGWAVAAGVLASVFAGGAGWEQHHRQQRRAAEATAQFETAERITDNALDQVRQQLQQAGIDPNSLSQNFGR